MWLEEKFWKYSILSNIHADSIDMMLIDTLDLDTRWKRTFELFILQNKKTMSFGIF